MHVLLHAPFLVILRLKRQLVKANLSSGWTCSCVRLEKEDLRTGKFACSRSVSSKLQKKTWSCANFTRQRILICKGISLEKSWMLYCKIPERVLGTLPRIRIPDAVIIILEYSEGAPHLTYSLPRYSGTLTLRVPVEFKSYTPGLGSI